MPALDLFEPAPAELKRGTQPVRPSQEARFASLEPPWGGSATFPSSARYVCHKTRMQNVRWLQEPLVLRPAR